MQMQLEYLAPFDPGAGTQFDAFPASPAVFALFPEIRPGLAPQPYLGHARDLRRRLQRLLSIPQQHTKWLNLWQVTRNVGYQCVGSNFEAQWLLFRLNQFYYPRTFRRRLRLKLPALVKVNLQNRFPRCYPGRRILYDGSLYYGPFPSRAAADRFTAEFLDLFKIRRCTPDLDPNPSHPGCIYSQMQMCLAPCFAGCTDVEYQQEFSRVVSFLNSEGRSLARELEAEREEASAKLDFERAARVHRKLEKVKEVEKLRPPLAREISQLHAVMILPGRGGNSITFFLVVAGELHGPGTLLFEENISSPATLDEQIQRQLAALAPPLDGQGQTFHASPWEHLSLLARWYYSSFRAGELVMLPPSREIPHARLAKLCRKVLAGERSAL